MSENKTLENLMEAFAGESQANRKIHRLRKKAEKEENRMPPSCSGRPPTPKRCMR